MKFIQRLGGPCYSVSDNIIPPVTEYQKILNMLAESGYTNDYKLFTNGTYVWIEGTNNDNQIKAIVLADENSYLTPTIAGDSENKVISSLTQVEGTVNLQLFIGKNVSFYIPNYTGSFIDKKIREQNLSEE